ncbi:hypothetical protein V6O07_09915, partial [Arthrospira platensis SPKY2]
KQLRDKLLHMEGEKISLLEKISGLEKQLDEMRERTSALQVARLLDEEGSLLARQKVNELLREIDKCQVLLNR